MTFPICAPAQFAPLYSIAYGNEAATPVDHDHPLPIISAGARLPATSTPLTGTASASGPVGPFSPEMGRPIWITLSGSWIGTAQLVRSTDGGVTRLPLSYVDGSVRAVWTGNANCAAALETVVGATYYLDIVLSSGTLAYEVRQ